MVPPPWRGQVDSLSSQHFCEQLSYLMFNFDSCIATRTVWALNLKWRPSAWLNDNCLRLFDACIFAQDTQFHRSASCPTVVHRCKSSIGVSQAERSDTPSKINKAANFFCTDSCAGTSLNVICRSHESGLVFRLCWRSGRAWWAL